MDYLLKKDCYALANNNRDEEMTEIRAKTTHRIAVNTRNKISYVLGHELQIILSGVLQVLQILN